MDFKQEAKEFYEELAKKQKKEVPRFTPKDDSNDKDKLAIASLVLGILSIFGIILTVVGVLLGAAGIVAALASRKRKKFFYKQAKWGLVLSIIGTVASFVYFIWILVTVTLPSI